MDDFQNIRNLNHRAELQPVNAQESQNGQIIYGQPGNNNIIHMADDIDNIKELLMRCPYHGIPYYIQLETFYNGLNLSTRLMVDI